MNNNKHSFRTILLSATVLLWLMLPFAASAQTWQFRIGGGLASHFKDSHPVGAFKFGVGYEHEFDQHWTLTPSVYFYAKGRKLPDESVAIRDAEGNHITDDAGNPIYGVKGTTITANYVEAAFPFSYYVRTAERRYFIFSLGPYVALGVAGKHTVKGDAEREGAEKLYVEQKTFDVDGIHRFDAGVQAAVAYQFTDNLVLGVEADFGLLPFSGDGGRNVSGLLTLSYRFDMRSR